MAQVVASPVHAFLGKRYSAERSEMPPNSASHHQQKRRRLHELNMDPADLFENERSDLSRVKRSRVQQNQDENSDMPVYSLRQMQFMEQRKDSEMNRLRHEMEQHCMQKLEEAKRKCDELENIRLHSSQQEQELGKIREENRILKQAVRLQHNNAEKTRTEIEAKARSEIQAIVNVGVQAAEHIRQLEQANYTLRAHLDQMNSFADVNVPRWGM
uniref:Uncharacterized protein n=1 Tax=Octactis speculum TaxID=3111310 RepID=A0A7S2HUR9_9STRA|mmetsp:Transcript_9483/g.12312  ORF Transcript_9483/g.12312 Transcript_9483/m.12312 type:complete len:214 (+) Transcript_9483:73-714(+)